MHKTRNHSHIHRGIFVCKARVSWSMQYIHSMFYVKDSMFFNIDWWKGMFEAGLLLHFHILCQLNTFPHSSLSPDAQHATRIHTTCRQITPKAR